MFKKIFSTFVLTLLVSSMLYAGGAENKVNHTAGYARMPAKNAECRKPDAMFFNPAGTAFMEDGLHIAIGNQFVYKKYTNEIDGRTLKTDLPTYLYPDLEIVWVKDGSSIFTGLTLFSGGGGIDWKHGSAETVNALKGINPALAGLGHSLECFSVVYGNMTGIAHQFWEGKLSIGAAAKLLYGYKTIYAELDEAPTGAMAALFGTGTEMADIKMQGWGAGAALGIHFKPTPKWDLAVTYNSQLEVYYEYTKFSGPGASLLIPGVSKGDHDNYIIPATVSIGLGWQALDPLYLGLGGTIYFNKIAGYDYDDGFELNIGAEYKINEIFTVSAGGFYCNIGCNNKEKGNNFTSPILDSMSYCGGFEIHFNKNLYADVGFFYTQYFDETFHDVKIDKKIFEGAVGLTYKLF